MKASESTSTSIFNEIDTNNLLGKPYNVILFNDNHNDFLSVIAQVSIAVKCSSKKAVEITMEAHNKGQAIAFTGSREKCELVDELLSAAPLYLTTTIIKA
jgi:ATP-dependent Clp protease adapter protein ClpS